MGYMERYQEWIERLPEDHPFHAELLSISRNDAEIKDRFYKEIEFGTAGLRGIFGAGTNRMNEFTVGRATQGIANYILNSGESRLTCSLRFVLLPNCHLRSEASRLWAVST